MATRIQRFRHRWHRMPLALITQSGRCPLCRELAAEYRNQLADQLRTDEEKARRRSIRLAANPPNRFPFCAGNHPARRHYNDGAVRCHDDNCATWIGAQAGGDPQRTYVVVPYPEPIAIPTSSMTGL